MEETKDVEPSVLVFIVKTLENEEVSVESLRSGTLDYIRKYTGKNILPGSGKSSQPGMAPSPVTPGQYHKIQQALRYINDNYRTDIRLDAAAREADMSPSHFSRTFKKVMGLSYQGYLNSCRIMKAKSLLRTSPQSVSEIATSVGFADPTGFGRIFKKLTGQTPSAYRKLRGSVFLQKKA